MAWTSPDLVGIAERFLRATPDLPGAERARLEDWLTGQRLIDRIHGHDPDLCQAFLKIERVFSDRPVHLLGEEVPSLAHNRLSVFFGKRDPETGERVPGREMMSMLLSERALCGLMMRTNRSETDAAMTAERVYGRSVLDMDHRPDDFAGRALEEGIARVAARPGEAIAACRAHLNKAGLPLPKKTVVEIASLLSRDITRRGDFAFLLERHVENIQKRSVAARIEAAHTVLHADRVIEAVDRPRLSAPAPDEATRAHRAFLDSPDTELSALLVRACDHEIDARLRLHKLRREDFPDGFSSPSARIRLREAGLSEKMAELDRMRRGLAPELVADRPAGLLIGAVNFVQGSRGGGHSDLVTVSNDHVRLTVETAEFAESFGNRRLRARAQILDFEMSTEDLMLLLRGHPDGRPVRCNLIRFAGRPVEQRPYANAFDRSIEEAVRGIGSEDGRIEALRKEILKRLEAGVTRKAQRGEIEELLEDLGQRLDRMVADRSAAVRERAVDLEAQDRELLRQALGEMRQDRLLQLLARDPDEAPSEDPSLS